MADSHVINDAVAAAVTTYVTKVGEMFQTDGNDPLVNIFAETMGSGGQKNTTLLADDFTSAWRQISGNSVDAGGRQTGVSRARSLVLTLQTFAPDLLSIDRKDFTYDGIALVARRITNYLSAQKAWKDQLLHTSLFQSSSAGPIGIDGVALLSTAHPNGPAGNQSNLGTTALSQASFDTGFVAMTSFLRENGEPFNVAPKYLVTGPKLRQLAMQITQADIRGQAVANDGLEAGTRIGTAGVTNVFNGIVDYVMDPRLVGTQDDYWYIVGETAGGLKPLVFIEGMSPTEQINTDMNSSEVMRTDHFTFGLIADAMVGGYGWPAIYGGVL